MTHHLAIKAITPVAHDVFCYDLEKPDEFRFEPGQATDVSIDKNGWRRKKRPFSFTSLPERDTLQFTIKSYRDHDGVTNQLSKLLVGDRLIVGEAWGTIAYRGRGVFIAGGAGVTPFIPILRRLNEQDGHLAGHSLILANRAEHDIILRGELEAMAGLELHHILSREEKTGWAHGRPDRAVLERCIDDFDQIFYICGPDAMVSELSQILSGLGVRADALVFEA